MKNKEKNSMEFLNTPMVEILSSINGFIMHFENTTIKDFEKFHKDIAQIVNPFLKDYGLEYSVWTIRTIKNNNEKFVDKDNFHLILNNIDVLGLEMPNSNFNTTKGKANAELKKIYFSLTNSKLNNQISLINYLKYLVKNQFNIEVVNYNTNIQLLKDEMIKTEGLLYEKEEMMRIFEEEFQFVIPQ